MKIVFFDTHQFEQRTFEKTNQEFSHQLTFFKPRLTPQTAPMVAGFAGVCAFANDKLSAETLANLMKLEVKLILLRSAGFNHVDLEAAQELGLKVARVPRYSIPLLDGSQAKAVLW